MNLNFLRYFTEVCRQGSIARAAEAVHVSQPSVTAAIKELESEYGVQLFFRSSSRVSLTPEGQRFRVLAEDFLKEAEGFNCAARELGKNPDVTLRVGIPAVLGTFFFKRIVPGFQKENPHLRLEITEVPTVTGVRMLEESKLDFIIGIEDENTKTFCAGAPLFETELYFAVSGENPLAKERRISRPMLKNEPFAIIAKGSYHYEAILERFCTPQTPLNVVLQSNQVATIRYMVENNYACTILYKEIFADNPKIVCIPLAEPIDASVGIYWRKNSYVTSAMKAFVRYLKRAAGE